MLHIDRHLNSSFFLFLILRASRIREQVGSKNVLDVTGYVVNKYTQLVPLNVEVWAVNQVDFGICKIEK